MSYVVSIAFLLGLPPTIPRRRERFPALLRRERRRRERRSSDPIMIPFARGNTSGSGRTLSLSSCPHRRSLPAHPSLFALYLLASYLSSSVACLPDDAPPTWLDDLTRTTRRISSRCAPSPVHAHARTPRSNRAFPQRCRSTDRETVSGGVLRVLLRDRAAELDALHRLH